MQDNLITKQDSVNELIKNKQSEIQSLTSELGDTKNKLAQLEAAAAEAERKQKEAAAAAAAAKKAQAAAQKEYKLIGVFGRFRRGIGGVGKWNIYTSLSGGIYFEWIWLQNTADCRCKYES